MTVIEPPVQYQYEYQGNLYVHEILASKVDGTCRAYGAVALDEITACSIRMKGGHCIVILPKIGIGGVGKPTHDALMRHEIAHCNGWSAGHPL